MGAVKVAVTQRFRQNSLCLFVKKKKKMVNHKDTKAQRETEVFVYKMKIQAHSGVVQ